MGTGLMVEVAGHALQVEAFARRFYTFFNERRFDEAESMVDQQALFSYPGAREAMIGRAGYRELVRRWLAGFPNGRLSIGAMHIHRDVAVADLQARGTHAGVLELPGLPPVPPTGRRVRLRMRETITVEGGLIVRVRREFSPDELCRTLEAEPI
jgi:predicted ester cyclase